MNMPTNFWYAGAVAYGPKYVLQVDTWAHDIYQAHGRPYVLADYKAPENVDEFLRRRPALYKEILAKCAELGRPQGVLTNIVSDGTQWLIV